MRSVKDKTALVLVFVACFLMVFSFAVMAQEPALPGADGTPTEEPGAVNEASAETPLQITESSSGPVHNSALPQVLLYNVISKGVDDKLEKTRAEDWIAKEIDANPKTGLVDPDRLKTYQESQGQAKKRCFSLRCAQDAGNALGAEFVVTGDVRAIGKTSRINMKLIDVKEGKAKGYVRKVVKENEPLVDRLKEATQELLAMMDPPPDSPLAAMMKEEEDKEESQKRGQRSFLKGELVTLSPQELVVPGNRAGLVMGARRIGFNWYLYLSPEVDLRFLEDEITKEPKLKMGFGVPLNLEMFTGEDRNDDGKLDEWDHAGSPRKEDWDSVRDAAKILRYLQYGRKEDKVYVNFNRIYDNTMGHGTVMKNYLPNVDVSRHVKVSGAVDVYDSYGGFQFYTNDVTWWNIVGGLAFIKPASFGSDHWMAESFSLGVQYMGDRDAPIAVRSDRAESDGSYVFDPKYAHVIGTSVELKIVKWPLKDTRADVKTYFDYSHLMDGGGGISYGFLGRFNIWDDEQDALAAEKDEGQGLTHGFRVRAEFKAFQDNFTPHYFDPFYEVMKFKYATETRPGTGVKAADYTVKPKLKEFTDREGDWNHFGGLVSFSYALWQWVGLTIALEDYSGKDNANFLAHLEIPAWTYIKLSASYYKTNFSDYGQIFNINDGTAMFIGMTRISPFGQILHLNAALRKTLQPSVKYFPNLEDLWDLTFSVDLSWEY